MMRYYRLRVLSTVMLIVTLAACGSAPKSVDSALADPSKVRPESLQEPTPRFEPPSASGNPRHYVVFGKRYHVLPTSTGFRQRGLASWYGRKFHGRRTSSGVRYNMHALTAAHKTLPLPTYVQVTRLDNGRRIVVKVNDRGPFVDGRIIDLSYAAARKLGMVNAGTVAVEVVALPPYQTLSGRVVQAQPKVQPKPKAIERPMVVTQPQVDQSREPALQRRAAGAYVQVGAFAVRRSAEQVQQRLQPRLSHDVHVLQPSNSGLYRVRVGPLAQRIQVDSLKLQLAELGFANAYVVDERFE